MKNKLNRERLERFADSLAEYGSRHRTVYDEASKNLYKYIAAYETISKVRIAYVRKFVLSQCEGHNRIYVKGAATSEMKQLTLSEFQVVKTELTLKGITFRLNFQTQEGFYTIFKDTIEQSGNPK